MHRSTWAGIAGLTAGLLLARTLPAVELAARDALTGAPLQASIEYQDDGVRQIAIDGVPRAFDIPAHTVRAIARAKDHHDLVFQLDAGAPTLTLLLDPLTTPPPFARMTQRVHDDPASRWLQGYVRRDRDGAAVAGARLEIDGQQGLSDARGYFEIPLPACDDTSRRSTLRVAADGLGPQEHAGLPCVDGAQRMLIALQDGAPRRSLHVVGALDRADRAVAAAATSPAQSPLPRMRLPQGSLLAPALAPPASIRVGYADAACTQSCCTGSCTNTCVLPLETYVRRGLDSEWIASWNTQSLRAGSVAYRSYGAWRVAHPIRAAFDICSSACCQVNDALTSSNTDNAIARTPGLLLTRGNGEAAAAEYSAENNSWDDPTDGLSCSNNDLSCGNGYAGSPANDWPCLADAVGAGHGCFGHGRGMSQWGTQRWAIDAGAPRWPWIVDHYFNDNGAGSGLRNAQMSSPLTLSVLTAQPASVDAGASLQIGATAGNAAGAPHSHLLIGASLYRSGVGYLDDSAHDAALSLPPGTQSIARTFDVPAASTAGSYDLLVSLYLDVDENGAISSADLPLALASVPHVVQVVTDRLFFDGFDITP